LCIDILAIVRAHFYARFAIQTKADGAIRDALRAIYHEHETGYGEEVTEKLILFALRTYRLKVTIKPVATAYYHGVQLRESPLDCLVIEDCILLTFTALFDNNQFNVNQGKSYLKALDLN
jgi:hypothetical protein